MAQIEHHILLHSGHALHGKTVNIEYSDNGKIVSISESNGTPKGYISAGWIDSYSTFGEPGFEQKETFKSGSKAAANGGFHTVLLSPICNPIRQTAEQISVAKYQSHNQVRIAPFGALTQDLKGKTLTDLFDLSDAGAIAFSNGENGIEEAAEVGRLLQYSAMTGKPIVISPTIPSLSEGKIVSEDEIALSTGLDGSPRISEQIAIERDTRLLEYFGGSIVWNKVTSKEGVEAIRAAKQKGLNCHATVSMWNLIFTSADIISYDSYKKTSPVLRSESDRKELIAAVIDGTIDCIVSDHCAHELESKELEFEYADAGIAGIEAMVKCLSSVFGPQHIAKAIEALTINPAKIFNLDVCNFEEGEKLKATCFTLESNSLISWKTKGINRPEFINSFAGEILNRILN